MTDQPFSPPARRRGARWPWVLALVAFLAGIGTMLAFPDLAGRLRGASISEPEAQTAAPAPAAPAAPAATVSLDGLAAREAMLEAQLRALEGRIAATDAAARLAAGNAARGEALLIAAASRRQIDRGIPLGELEAQLRARFEGADPAAVRTVVDVARAPVTREDLRLALEQIAPQLTGAGLEGGVLASITRSLSGLVVLRRVSTPSPRPADRLARARRLIDAGNVEAAVAEVARMPGATGATSWLEAAGRYIDARRALNRLEVVALAGRATPAVPPPAAIPPTLPPPAAPAPEADAAEPAAPPATGT